MHTTVITPPELIVSLDEAKRHLRIDGNDDDDVVLALIEAAQQNIDGPSGWLGRCVGMQTLEVTTDTFDFGIRLPYPPTIAVTSVKYDDPSGVEQTLDLGGYRLDVTGTVVCAFNGSWPATRNDCGVIRVRYSAGYANPPAPIKAAVLLMVSHLYNNRDAVTTTQAQPAVLPFGVAFLLDPYRELSV